MRAINVNNKMDAFNEKSCSVAGEKRNPAALALRVCAVVVHVNALIIGSDAGKVRFADVDHFHSLFLLVMEGRPWYNGRALVGGASGVLLASVAVASGGRGVLFALVTSGAGCGA